MDRKMMITVMAAVIVAMNKDTWQIDSATHQAELWVDGVRDGRISDVTFGAYVAMKEIADDEDDNRLLF